MCTRFVSTVFWMWIAVVSLGLMGAPDSAAQETLNVYGSEGPAPAIQEAAGAFGKIEDLKVTVVTGPPERWIQEAGFQADVVFASADFMMDDFVRTKELSIDESSIEHLYMRPSAVLVRPGNPKRITDFPDLLKPDMRVMVVSGSGQTGLWEDMAGKHGNVATVRAFRENIVAFAADSTEAMRLWDAREDIDAYVTWNIWHMPLRNRAQLVSVSDEWKVYRQCSIALTERGKRKPSAKSFVEFLTSPEGAAIFESWYWMPTPEHASPLIVRKDITIVCRIDSDDWKDGVGAGLAFVRGLVESYRSIGTLPNELHISAVVHGDAAYWMLNDASYRAFKKGAGMNPNKAMIEELKELGVSLELCGDTMKEHGWTNRDLVAVVEIVPNAHLRIVDLELQGYAYIRF